MSLSKATETLIATNSLNWHDKGTINVSVNLIMFLIPPAFNLEK